MLEHLRRTLQVTSSPSFRVIDPSQTVTMSLVDFDTGSSDLLIPSIMCNSTCDGHVRYDANQSTTSYSVNGSFSLRYGDGSTAVGELYTDNVLIGGYEVFLLLAHCAFK